MIEIRELEVDFMNDNNIENRSEKFIPSYKLNKQNDDKKVKNKKTKFFKSKISILFIFLIIIC